MVRVCETLMFRLYNSITELVKTQKANRNPDKVCRCYSQSIIKYEHHIKLHAYHTPRTKYNVCLSELLCGHIAKESG